jgi:hypothetical protein
MLEFRKVLEDLSAGLPELKHAISLTKPLLPELKHAKPLTKPLLPPRVLEDLSAGMEEAKV